MKTATKERPILFSAPMILALLEGRKTQTRRIVKCLGGLRTGDRWAGRARPASGRLVYRDGAAWDDDARDAPIAVCPCGKPGDRLWVRESIYIAEPYSWGTDPSGEQIEVKGVPRGPVHYAADGEPANTPNSHYPKGLTGGAISAPDPHAIWRRWSSMNMPRWASRITLEITDVRVERLNSITDEDAQAEGVANFVEYIGLWGEIYGYRSKNDNPWVWVIEFARVHP